MRRIKRFFKIWSSTWYKISYIKLCWYLSKYSWETLSFAFKLYRKDPEAYAKLASLHNSNSKSKIVKKDNKVEVIQHGKITEFKFKDTYTEEPYIKKFDKER